MRTIWKFPLEVTDRQKLEMPAPARVLTVATQGNEPQLWAEVDDEATAAVTLELVTVMTGNPIPDEPLRHLGTYQLMGGDYVGHVFVVDDDVF